MKLCFATNNTHKIEEIHNLLSGRFEILSLEDIGCREELPENQTTLEGNSLEKAMYVWEHFGVSCFADDTGLEVEALHGEPGVYSARYAGLQRKAEDNMNLLLKNLQGKTNRKARFRTSITLILNGKVHQFEGVVNGHIDEIHRGTKGFGYDPLFVPDGHTRTFAEMDISEKGNISHRGKAIEALVAFLIKEIAE
ncbi:non-canonical purine NTP diphosphatase [Rhodocytophaga rosea]|uniref:dITP/XTP pyrophosphatase n=1 Tax=Rhodocytophaga rosea TaxID=2704465 RepID=A0A6C0GMS3_9BACT|nr:non-canonical purine NTP diphosphatase [Rhodocytophaga rosea]QHT69338.1 non-canonical purine NTP diphosphatase [Rhodocytophaga rosea]